MQVQRLGGVSRSLSIFKPSKINSSPLKPLGYDTVSFSARDKKLLSADEASAAAKKLRTSTSGYRASINDKFNDNFVYTMTNALVKDFRDRGQHETIIGGDTREATKKYAPVIKDIATDRGINVYVPQLDGAKKGEISPVASPVLALCTKKFDIPLGVLLTASHNPWDDGGYNFLTNEGAVADDTVVAPLADNLEYIGKTGKGVSESKVKGSSVLFNPYEIYKDDIEEKGIIDFENIKNGNIDIFYENFGGTGGYYLPQLMSDHGVEFEKVLSSKTEGPNPTAGNLKNLAAEVAKSENPLKIGIANDGDSDRFGIIDENGKFISPADVIMLCSYHLIKNKGMTKGTIIKNQATSDKIDVMADYFNKKGGYDIDVEQTPVGFKYLGGKMVELENSPKETIVAGEESGGLTIRGHIPEKDGFVAVSTILDLVATEQKPIGQILAEVNEEIGGNFVTTCTNMKFDSDDKKDAAVASFQEYFDGDKTDIAGIEIDYDKTYAGDKKIRSYKPSGDGTKLYLKDGSSVLIRKSGTEPVMRLYIDASSQENYDKLFGFLTSKVEDMGGIRK